MITIEHIFDSFFPHQKRIPPPFLTHCRLGAVAGEDAGFVGEAQDLLADALDQGGVVAAGQIGAADAPPEDDVAAEEQVFPGAVEEHMAGRVPRRVADFEVVCPQVQDLAVGQVDARLRAGVAQVDTEERCSTLGLPQGQVRVVKSYRRKLVESVDDAGRAAKVIEVGVGQPKRLNLPAAFFCCLADAITIPSGIDHNGVIGFSVGNQVDVG